MDRKEGFTDHKQSTVCTSIQQSFIVCHSVPGSCSAWIGGSLSLRNSSLVPSKHFLNCGVPTKEEDLLYTVSAGTRPPLRL